MEASTPNVCFCGRLLGKPAKPALQAPAKADESFRTAKMALRSETLTEDQLKAIIKEATEAMRKQEEIVQMAQKRLEEMRRL